MSETLQPEELLADAAWLHRLARSLAGSEADADDLVQESWIAAWQKRPDADRSLRPWLAKVVRDVANMKRRGERRRIAREQALEEPQPASSPDALLERMRLHRLIVDLVLDLPEPYRSTVVWRFVEGRSAADIARSLGIPESTVRGRLRDALERLRAALDAKTGTRKAWAPALIAFAHNGVIVTKTSKSIVTIVLLLLLGVVGIVAVPRLLRGSQEADAPAAAHDQGSSGIVVRALPADGTQEPAWFGVRGAAPRRIAGRVTFENKPVAGATVSLHSQLVEAGIAPAVRTTTAADGTFDLGPRTVATYQVTAETPDHVAAISVVDLANTAKRPPPDQLELRLHGCSASVSGTVFDASGGVIAKARVRRHGVAGVVADERGAYKLCVPRGGESPVEYSADGYASVVLGLAVDGDVHKDVVLVPEATIAVRVVREDDSPIAGALVFATPQQWAPDRGQSAGALTDDEGRARIGRLVPGPYRIRGLGDGVYLEAPVVALAVVGTSQEVVLRMVATARISGVVMLNGKPIDDANVVAVRTSPLGRSHPGFTRADGVFTLERVLAGDVKFTAFPYAVKSPQTFHAEANKTYDKVVIEVEALGSVRGRVTRLGKPVEYVQVCCVRGTEGPATQLSGPDGRYEFRGVPEGEYEIAGGSAEVGAFAFGKKVKLARGEQATVDVELDQAAAISGTVVDQQGKPVAGVFVRWLHEKTGDVGGCAADANGRYRCAQMSGGGAYRAAVFPAQSRMKAYPTADGSPYPVRDLEGPTSVIDDVTLAIDYRRLAISGRVVDGAGAPVADAEVHALATAGTQPPQFQPWLRLPKTFTGVDGTFTLSELAPGAYALQARSSDGGEATVTQQAAGATGVTIKLERPGAIAGTLTGYPAPPAIYARVLGGATREIPAAVDGTTFRISGLRPGRYLVGAQTTFEGDARMVDVRAGQTTQVAFAAKGRGVVEATVLDFRTRAPISNARCHAVMVVDGEQTITNWDPTAAAKPDAQGRVVIDPAPAGSINVNCVMPAPRRSAPSVDTVLPADGRVSVTLLSAELTVENGGSTGIGFDWRVAAPRISDLDATSPAGTSGLVIGDVVTAVDGTSVEGLNGMGVYYLIANHAVGREVSVTVARGKTFTFALGPHRD